MKIQKIPLFHTLRKTIIKQSSQKRFRNVYVHKAQNTSGEYFILAIFKAWPWRVNG
jgi:hypothetical protein